MWNMIYLVTGAIFIALLVIIFFSKEVISSKENKVFKLILLSNLFGYITEIPLQILVRTININSVMIDAFCRFYLVLITIFYFLFTMYVLIICLNKSKQTYNKLIKIGTICTLIVEIVITILLFAAPFSKYYDSSKMYIEGPAVDLLKLYITIQIGLYIILLLINFKKLKDKKYLPIFFIIICLVFMTILNTIDPSILITNMIGTFICYTMFFTLENPDLKMMRELELAKNQAEKANRAKSDFLSSMSHEIRTPLNAIVGLSEVINSSDDLKEIHEDSKDVVNASHTLLDIVNGILDISRIEADKMEVVDVNYNPIKEFEELTKLIETRIGEKDVELRTNFAEDIPNCLVGDRGKVKQIITNLLSNAVKYTEKGYIDFDVKCINNNNNCKLTISIKDTGRGIKKDQIDKLFTKFNRLEEDMNTTIEGTGLGLAITKSLVELMGGKIVVDSTYGEGSKFTVFLEQKIVSDEEIIEDEKKNTNTEKYDNSKVLVVDDNKLNIKVASKIFKELNIEVDEANSGFECIDKIENGNKYDIIFMDIMMPKMSGVETLKKLKNNKDFSIPVVALTADAMEGKSNKYIEVGFDDYITKPINRDKLNQILNKLLRNDNQKTKDENIIDDKVIPVTDEDIQRLEEIEEKQSSETKKGNIEFLKEKDIDVDASIELLGDIEMFNQTLKDFIEESKDRIPRIIKNKMSENMSDYAIDVHAMKSDSKYLGFKKLAELSYDHEMKSKANDYEYVALHFEELIDEYNRIRDVINSYLQFK